MGEQAIRKSLEATLSSLRRPSLSLCSQQSPIAQRRRLEDHSSYHGWFAFAFACNQAPFFFASLLALSQPPPPPPSCCCCCCCLFCTYEDCVHKQVVSSLAINQSIMAGFVPMRSICCSSSSFIFVVFEGCFFLSFCFLAGFCFAEIWNFGYLHHHRQPVILTLTAMQEQQQQQRRNVSNRQGKRHFGPVVKSRLLLLW